MFIQKRAVRLGKAVASSGTRAKAPPSRWMNIYGFWQQAGDDSFLSSFAEHSRAVMRRLSEHGEYVNFRSREHTRPITDFTRHIYGEEKYRQLQRVKQQYDPANLFRSNYNVAPER